MPQDKEGFDKLLKYTDPWELRRKGLMHALTEFEFGRVLLHLAQRRGAVGLDAEVGDKGKVKKAIVDLHLKILERYGAAATRETVRALGEVIETLGRKKNRTDAESEELDKAQEQLEYLNHSLLEEPTITFGRFIADLRDDRRTAITTPDRRKVKKGPREWRGAVRNKAGNFEFHADRAMIRDEFKKLWNVQKQFGGALSQRLTKELRLALDDESHDSVWRHKGLLLFGQRKPSWDLGTLGRCVLEPTERCVPHADMYASHYLVVETVNNLRVIERGMPRPLSKDERNKVKLYLSGPLGVVEKGKQKGRPKRSVSISDLRDVLGWRRASKSSPFRFKSEDSDEDRPINTDWFSREIIHGAISWEKWAEMSPRVQDGINRAILKHDPDDDKHPAKLKSLVMQDWAGLTESQADALVAAWKKRPRPDAKRLNMSRRAVRNLLTVMDRDEPWPDEDRLGQFRWLTQIEARKLVAKDNEFRDVTTGQPLDQHARRRYETGAKGATARDRHYMRKHLLKRKGQPVYGPDGLPLHALPPAPLISNPVVRKSVHEMRRHVIEYLTKFRCKPDEIRIELAREAKMGKVDADRVLFRNRLRNRIRNEIAEAFRLTSVSSTQRRTAIDRVILAVQQDCICALCGQRNGITLRTAASGQGCEIAHIVPKACGGHNGLGNLVLAHTKCNRDMDRRTPRDFWDQVLPGGSDEGYAWIESMYGNIARIKPSEVKKAMGVELWKCYLTEQPRPKRGSQSALPPNYFTRRFDLAKIEQFKKDVSNIQGMTARQLAATQFASRQVMSYLADALFDGEGLPERGGARRISTTDGMWTSRLRREWGLFFDPHEKNAKGLTNDQEQERREKDRGDHRHHAIDAVAIALCTEEVQRAWEDRERRADNEGINTADEEEMENYRRLHPLKPPAPFEFREELREAVRRSVFGDGPIERPVCHRPAKRKLVGALHEETLFGPVLDSAGKLTGNFTARKSVYALTPNHLRVPAGWDELSEKLDDTSTSESQRRAIRKRLASMRDPEPGKPGLVRDRALRDHLRKSLRVMGLSLGQFDAKKNSVKGGFTPKELKKVLDEKTLKHASGVPIRSIILLRTISDPVIAPRWRYDYANRTRYKVYDGDKREGDARAARAYVGGNNHHIEIRVATNKKGKEIWRGEIVSAYETAQRKLARLRAFRGARIPNQRELRKLKKTERETFRAKAREVERTYPLIDRSDCEEKGGRFVMSLCEGEMLLMKHKRTGDVGYFVVAKLDKRQSTNSIVVVPHWDARSATLRKDSKGKKVADSSRDQFSVSPADLKKLSPPGHAHAVKVRVTPLGEIVPLNRD